MNKTSFNPLDAMTTEQIMVSAERICRQIDNIMFQDKFNILTPNPIEKMKKEIVAKAHECGYEANYSGDTKTFFLKPIAEIKGHISLIGLIKKSGFKSKVI